MQKNGSPEELLRYRTMVVRQAVRMKNKIAGLLMECGVEYCGTRLHGKKYFQELVESLSEVPSSVNELLAESRGALEMFEATQKKLERHLAQDALVKERVERLQTIPGVGLITALTWVLEVGEVTRFSSVKDAVSDCGLTARLDSLPTDGTDGRGDAGSGWMMVGPPDHATG